MRDQICPTPTTATDHRTSHSARNDNLWQRDKKHEYMYFKSMLLDVKRSITYPHSFSGTSYMSVDRFLEQFISFLDGCTFVFFQKVFFWISKSNVLISRFQYLMFATCIVRTLNYLRRQWSLHVFFNNASPTMTTRMERSEVISLPLFLSSKR